MNNPSPLLGLTVEQKQACLATPPSSVTFTKIGQPILSSSRLRIIPQQSGLAVCASPQRTINITDPSCFLGGDQTNNKPSSVREVASSEAPLSVNNYSTGVSQQQKNQSQSAVVYSSAVKSNSSINNLLGQKQQANKLQLTQTCLQKSPSAACGLLSILTPQNKKQNNLRLQQQQSQQRVSLANLAMHRNLSPQLKQQHQTSSPFWQLGSCSKNLPEQSGTPTGVSRCVIVSPVQASVLQCSSPITTQQTLFANRNILQNSQPTVISSSRVILQSRQNVQQQINVVPSNITAAPISIARQFQQIAQPNVLLQPDQLLLRPQGMQKSASLQTLSCGKQFIISPQEQKETQKYLVGKQQYHYEYDEIPQLLEVIPNYPKKDAFNEEERVKQKANKRQDNPLKLEDLLGNQKQTCIDQPSASSPQVLPQEIINQSEALLHQQEDSHLGETASKQHIINFPDGSYYIGDIVQGKMEGLGELFSAQGKIIYEGEWQGGLYHGRGVLTSYEVLQAQADTDSANILKSSNQVNYKDFSDSEQLQTIYEGQFSFGKKEGAGIQHFADGSQFFGGFSQGIIQGAGAFTSAEKENKRKIAGIWNQSKLEVEFK